MNAKSKGFITLVIGGARSGKSSYAGRLAETRFKKPLYLATAEALDSEMTERIERHRMSRGPQWSCVEEPLDVPRVLENLPLSADGVLLDCVTLWLCNVLMKDGRNTFESRKDALLSALKKTRHEVIIVGNEVGMGIVPDNELSREFRDYAGWLNQALAEISDKVVLVIAGLPVVLKEKKGSCEICQIV